MSNERQPGGQQPIDTLDKLVGEAQSSFVASEMTRYVQGMIIGSPDWFFKDTKRMEKAGAELARQLTLPPKQTDRMLGLTRCLRFGLKMSQLVAGQDAYKETLSRIEDVLLLPSEALAEHVENSYERYLEHQPHLMPALRDNLMPIAPANYQELGQNVISMALEFTDQYVYSRIQAERMDDELTWLLAPPDDPDK